MCIVFSIRLIFPTISIHLLDLLALCLVVRMCVFCLFVCESRNPYKSLQLYSKNILIKLCIFIVGNNDNNIIILNTNEKKN